MNLKDISIKSIKSDGSSYSKWLSIDDEIGYLGVPINAEKDIFSRDILCDLQGEKHIPLFEKLGEMDNHMWYKTEYLKSFIETFPTIVYTPWTRLSHIRYSIIAIPSNNSQIDSQIDSVNQTLQLIADKVLSNGNYYDSWWDLHEENIRIREDGTLMISDPLY